MKPAESCRCGPSTRRWSAWRSPGPSMFQHGAKKKSAGQPANVFKTPQLWHYAHGGDLGNVTLIVSRLRETSLNVADVLDRPRPYDHTTALWAATSKGHMAVVQYLVSRGKCSKQTHMSKYIPTSYGICDRLRFTYVCNSPVHRCGYSHSSQ